ncbi:hypothetical protein Taro_014199 [Colocasia esculenta]|uniref:Dolichyl-diphosphooligosaccharide--protein glycosyltransferase subunit 4A n=1 Tax=Colocasia esculenta TaxID=4460 RepID=A0A843UE88_COLES|nr:hypothetical protein [Colocasia esculenta]
MRERSGRLAANLVTSGQGHRTPWLGPIRFSLAENHNERERDGRKKGLAAHPTSLSFLSFCFYSIVMASKTLLQPLYKGDSEATLMIDDQDLGFFANFLGFFVFVLVIAYHYVVADPKYEGN